MSFVILFIRKVLFGTMMKAAISALLSNEKLQRELFFWLAHKIVAQTETKADDEFLKIVEDALGEKPDLEGLKKLGG